MTTKNLREEDPYFAGEKLWGDEFTMPEIEAWFADEREGYAQLGAGEHGDESTYGYHQLNIAHGFRHLPDRPFARALGLGSAYGGEFSPVIHKIHDLTILEPSTVLRSPTVAGVPVRYVDPQPAGQMTFDDGSFDLVLSLGTLHHIPNVSRVVAEIGRVTAKGGWVLIREPVTSLGDWTKPRPGLTSRERGIPAEVFRRAFDAAGLRVVHETPCMFPTTRRLSKYHLGYDDKAGVAVDRALSVLTSWNRRYHSTKSWHKLHPTARFFVLQK